MISSELPVQAHAASDPVQTDPLVAGSNREIGAIGDHAIHPIIEEPLHLRRLIDDPDIDPRIVAMRLPDERW